MTLRAIADLPCIKPAGVVKTGNRQIGRMNDWDPLLKLSHCLICWCRYSLNIPKSHAYVKNQVYSYWFLLSFWSFTMKEDSSVLTSFCTRTVRNISLRYQTAMASYKG